MEDSATEQTLALPSQTLDHPVEVLEAQAEVLEVPVEVLEVPAKVVADAQLPMNNNALQLMNSNVLQ